MTYSTPKLNILLSAIILFGAVIHQTAYSQLEIAFDPDGSIVDHCVATGQTIDIPVYVVLTGSPVENGDLTVGGIVSMGTQLNYDAAPGSATVTAITHDPIFVEFQLSEVENADGRAAFAGAVGFTDPPAVGSSILLGSFTFQAGAPGNVTVIAANLPDTLSVTGPYFVSGSNPPVALDGFVTTVTAVATVSTSFDVGDVNQDGNVNLLDVSPFIDLISIGVFQCEADLNGDGVVNLLDVDPFIAVLSG